MRTADGTSVNKKEGVSMKKKNVCYHVVDDCLFDRSSKTASRANLRTSDTGGKKAARAVKSLGNLFRSPIVC